MGVILAADATLETIITKLRLTYEKCLQRALLGVVLVKSFTLIYVRYVDESQLWRTLQNPLESSPYIFSIGKMIRKFDAAVEYNLDNRFYIAVYRHANGRRPLCTCTF